MYGYINEILLYNIRFKNSKFFGGKKNSTNKKVNILNDNNKLIERIVYIDNDKNKFIKLNKKYELLSNFKYNRKNKVYYKKMSIKMD